jgi:hypothetical protein
MEKNIRDNIHYLITLFLFFGGIISNNCKMLQIHAIFCILVIFHWITNNNKCFLSEYDYKDGNGYTMHILNYLGINIKQENNELLLNIIAYSSVLIPLLFSYNKILKNCKNIF